MEPELRYTPRLLNLLLGIVGLVIIWSATHNWTAVLGGFIAGLHFSIRVK
jgi:hypothetical protein